MTSPLATRQLLRESAPVAGILLFWVVLSSVVRPDIGGGLLRAGVIMPGLYTMVRGVMFAKTVHPTVQPTDLEGVLRENVTVAVPAGLWFIAAHVIYFVEHLWDMMEIPGVATSPTNDFAFVFIGTDVATVFLYAIVVGVSRIHEEPTTQGAPVRIAGPLTTKPYSYRGGV